MKITMIGMSGSGKTCLMSALKGSIMDAPVEGFKIKPLPANSSQSGDAEFASFYAVGEWGNLDIAEGVFPEATIKSTVWPFELREDQKSLVNFDWVDYRGGVLRDIQRGRLSDPSRKLDADELLTHIVFSDGIVCCLDAVNLTSFDDVAVARRMTGAVVIQQLLEIFYEKYRRNLMIVVAITKSDAVDNKWRTDKYGKLLNRAREVMQDLVGLCKRSDSKWRGCFVPVSAVGEGRATNVIAIGNGLAPAILTSKIEVAPIPMNAEHVIFYYLWQEFNRTASEVAASAFEAEKAIRKCIEQSTFAGRLVRWLSGKPSPEEAIKKLSKRSNEDHEILNAYRDRISRVYNRVCADITVF